MRALLVMLAAVAVSTAPATPTTSVRPKPGPVAFVNVNVVSMNPGEAAVRKRMTVIVEDGMIAAIGPARALPVPPDAEVIDARGKYLLPGLNDMHLHLRHLRGLPEKFEPADVYTILLAHGITGIFDPWGFPQAFAWQRDVERGKVLGPRFRFASPGIDEDQYESVDAIAADISKWAGQGYRWIKSHDLRTPEAFAAVFAAANVRGLPVVGHALRPGFPISATLLQQPRMIAHIEEILATTAHDAGNYVSRFAAPVAEVAASRTWITSTLVTYEIIAATVDDALFAELPGSPGMEYLPPTVALLWSSQNPYRQDGFLQDRDHWLFELSVEQHIVRQLRASGHLDRLLIGTDAGGPPFVVPGTSLHDELRLLQQAGLTAREALQTATFNPAVFFEEEDVAGTIAVGKRADLILVAGNPTRNLANLRKLSGTMVRGVWLPQEELQARLDELRDRW